MRDHLSDDAIQQYALDQANCPPWIGQHISACERCRVQVENYRLLMATVRELAPPTIELDRAALMTMLERGNFAAGHVAAKRDRWLGFWLAGAGLSMLAAGWIFRSTLLTITGDLPLLILYVLVGVSAGIAVACAMGVVVRYRHELKNLDLS